MEEVCRLQMAVALHYLPSLHNSTSDGQPTEPRIHVMIIILIISLFGEQLYPILLSSLQTPILSCLFSRRLKNHPLYPHPSYIFLCWKAFWHRLAPKLALQSLTADGPSLKVLSLLLPLSISFKTLSRRYKGIRLKSTSIT